MTIEPFLRAALSKVDAIRFNEWSKAKWFRAARTDKGVSALLNILTVKIRLDFFFFKWCFQLSETYPKLATRGFSGQFSSEVEWRAARWHSCVWYACLSSGCLAYRITTLQPTIFCYFFKKLFHFILFIFDAPFPPFRVFIGFVEIPEKVNARNTCDSRTYHYVCPTSLFAPRGHSGEFKFDEAMLARINNLINKYTGTHYFHNFTKDLKPNSRIAKRTIMRFEVRTPFAFVFFRKI